MRYAAHEILVAPARPTCELGRLAIGVASILLGTFAFSVVFWSLCDMLLGATGIMPTPETGNVGTTPLAVVINLFAFSAIIAALADHQAGGSLDVLIRVGVGNPWGVANSVNCHVSQ